VAQTLEQAERMRAPRALALCRCFGGALEFQNGRFQVALAELEQAVRLYREVGSASGESLSLQRMGVLLTVLGALDQAHETMSGAIAVAERAAMRSHCLTRLHASLARNRLAARDLDAADLSLSEGLETARRHGHCVTCNALLLPEAVRVALAHGRVEDADAHASELESIAGKFESQAWSAMARHGRARVLLARRRFAEAARAFEQANGSFLAAGQPYEAARCQLGLAVARRGGGGTGKRDADKLTSRARAALQALGAAGVED
jgi:tetratricopeptide (TPR) repeat protein